MLWRPGRESLRSSAKRLRECASLTGCSTGDYAGLTDKTNSSRSAIEVLTVDLFFAGIAPIMKIRIAALALALSFLGTAAGFAANAHLGTWKSNEAKSKFAPGMGRTSTVHYAEKKDQMSVTVDGVDKDGKPTHGVWVGKTDGQIYKVKGNLAWDAMAYKMVNDHTFDITAMKGGKMSWSGRTTVAPDGKTRTLNMTGTGPDGKTFKNRIVYDRA